MQENNQCGERGYLIELHLLKHKKEENEHLKTFVSHVLWSWCGADVVLRPEQEIIIEGNLLEFK